MEKRKELLKDLIEYKKAGSHISQQEAKVYLEVLKKYPIPAIMKAFAHIKNWQGNFFPPPGSIDVRLQEAQAELEKRKDREEAKEFYHPGDKPKRMDTPYGKACLKCMLNFYDDKYGMGEEARKKYKEECNQVAKEFGKEPVFVEGKKRI